MYCASNGEAGVLEVESCYISLVNDQCQSLTQVCLMLLAQSGASSSGGDRRCDTEASNKKRKLGDCRHLWHTEWEDHLSQTVKQILVLV